MFRRDVNVAHPGSNGEVTDRRRVESFGMEALHQVVMNLIDARQSGGFGRGPSRVTAGELVDLDRVVQAPRDLEILWFAALEDAGQGEMNEQPEFRIPEPMQGGRVRITGVQVLESTQVTRYRRAIEALQPARQGK
jgi:hypothetical protein